MESVYVRDIELRAAYDKHISDPDFPIVPLFMMDTQKAEAKLTISIPGITGFNGVIAENHPTITDAAKRVRQMLLKSCLGQLGGPTVNVALSSWQPTSRSLDIHLDLDWSPFHLQKPGEFFSQATWEGIIQPALMDIKNALPKAGCSRLRVHPVCHLTAGMAFGYTFRKEARFDLDIIQKDWDCWSSDAQPAQDCGMLCKPPQTGQINADKVALVVSLSRNARSHFTKFIGSNGLSFRAIIYCDPASGAWPMHVTDGSVAVAIARMIREAVVDAGSRFSCPELHVFATIPVGLSILIGRELNACGAIQLYEHNNATGEYTPSWRLGVERGAN